MVNTNFSTSWTKSTQIRKQRKYRFNAPLHVKQKFMRVHLSKELRSKHGKRAVQIRKGDTAKVLRGSYKGKEAKVDRVNIKQGQIYLTGIEKNKKDGSKLAVAFTPSNLMITILLLQDKKRKAKLERTTNGKKSS